MRPFAKVEICGVVDRKFVSNSGKFAKLVIAHPGRRGEVKTDCRSFDPDTIRAINELGVGQMVTVECSLEREKLTDKAKSEVKVDNFAVWMTALTINSLKVDDKPATGDMFSDEDEKPAAKKDGKGWDSDIPF